MATARYTISVDEQTFTLLDTLRRKHATSFNKLLRKLAEKELTQEGGDGDE